MNTFTPGPTPNSVRAADGSVLTAPDGWVLFPPGDAALTRRVKAAGDHWVVAEKKGRKVFSRGVWAPAEVIERIRAELEAERSTEGFAKRKEADARRRDKAQAEYVEDFLTAVVQFLAFHPVHADLGNKMAQAGNPRPIWAHLARRNPRRKWSHPSSGLLYAGASLQVPATGGGGWSRWTNMHASAGLIATA